MTALMLHTQAFVDLARAKPDLRVLTWLGDKGEEVKTLSAAQVRGAPCLGSGGDGSGSQPGSCLQLRSGGEPGAPLRDPPPDPIFRGVQQPAMALRRGHGVWLDG